MKTTNANEKNDIKKFKRFYINKLYFEDPKFTEIIWSSPLGTCAMVVESEDNKKGDGTMELDNVMKKLELVNESLSGKKKIDEYNSVDEIFAVSSNSRNMLAKAVIELYEISATLLKNYAVGNESRNQEERHIPTDNITQ